MSHDGGSSFDKGFGSGCGVVFGAIFALGALAFLSMGGMFFCCGGCLGGAARVGQEVASNAIPPKPESKPTPKLPPDPPQEKPAEPTPAAEVKSKPPPPPLPDSPRQIGMGRPPSLQDGLPPQFQVPLPSKPKPAEDAKAKVLRRAAQLLKEAKLCLADPDEKERARGRKLLENLTELYPGTPQAGEAEQLLSRQP